MADKKSPVRKDDGSHIFADFSYGLYLLDTPRNLGEQLGSLALVGGRNVVAQKGALINQYGYFVSAELGSDEDRFVYASKCGDSNDSIFLICLSGKIYFYTATQGLKRYKSELDIVISDPLVARRGQDMCLTVEGSSYLFGGYYEEAEAVELNANVPVADFVNYYEFQIPIADMQYYWVGKSLCMDTDTEVVVSLVEVSDTIENTCIVRAYTPGEHTTVGTTVTLSEKTLMPLTFVYKPEDTAVEQHSIVPRFTAWADNRLFIEDVNGYIYYSQVGVLDSFEEKYGAGYFGGFYNDTSNLLDIESYKDGAVICKENGIYYLTVSDTETNITKISNIGQQYAQDHVIVNNTIYAFDTHSGSLVIAAQQNMFGSVVAGKEYIKSEYIDAVDNGIVDSPRTLVYNQEAGAMMLYYGANLNKAMVIIGDSLYPRELDCSVTVFRQFNNGVLIIDTDSRILQDYKQGTLIPNLTAVAEFEPIALKDNRCICASLIEVTELNGIEYWITTLNECTSYQHIIPPIQEGVDVDYLPPMLYSDKSTKVIYDSFELERVWAEKKSNVTRIAAPMSGRRGVQISIEFPENQAFCLCALRLNDFSQGE